MLHGWKWLAVGSLMRHPFWMLNCVWPIACLTPCWPAIWEYPRKLDSMEETIRLAKVWDARGFLFMHTKDIQKERRHQLVRVFKCLKNEVNDRQIGDRRGRNAVEGRICGPSKQLPTGADLLDFQVDPTTHTLSIVCTDRRDFYHQFSTTLNRTMANTVGPHVPLDRLRSTQAFEEYTERVRGKKQPRVVRGDLLGLSDRQNFSECPAGSCMLAFKSIFQGDHTGVEIATSAHEGLLKSVGLLDEYSRMVSNRPFWGDSMCQGLVIDDYFAISRVPRGVLVSSPAEECLKRSKDIYRRYELIGSDDKDVCGARKAKVIGACINAEEPCQARGHILVSSPAEKRYALSWLTLQVCQLSLTSDALHLCLLGGWTSILLFRRPMMSILQKSFRLVDIDVFDANSPKMLKLPREVATELTLLGILAPLAVADIGASFCEKLFATDASLEKGAIVHSEVSHDVAEVLWKSLRSKGGYSKLLSKTQSIFSRSFDFEEPEPPAEETVRRPMAYRFDFVEVFAGASRVTNAVSSFGHSVCSPIDISFDQEMDVSAVFVIEWLMHLVSNHFVKAVMLEPPCTTFSVMRRPALRSKFVPFGFDVHDPQTKQGTVLAQRALQLLYLCERCGATAILENPWSSKMKFLPSWKALACSPHAVQVRCDSCACGSEHLKSFCFLCVWALTEPISRRCSGDHSHIPVEGSYTKASATYVEPLAFALAQVISNGIRRLTSFLDGIQSISTDGLENQLINKVSLCADWKLDSVWTLKVGSHINLLELSAVVRLASRLVREGKSLRVVVLVDSNVIKCAASKGRSASKALCKMLCRLAALCIVGGLYLVFGFIPTRLNPADDPTRGVPLRGSIPGFDFAAWDRSWLFSLASIPKAKRWALNWVRLLIGLVGTSALGLCDLSSYRKPPFPYGLSLSPAWPRTDPSLLDLMDFDSSLGFPGEGPLSCFTCKSMASRVWILVVLGVVSLSHGVIVPRNAGDIRRQALRSARPPLQEGRPVLGVTSQLRTGYINQFSDWIRSQGFNLDDLLTNHFQTIDQINKLLVQYGRCLYAVGRPYNHYAETINALAASKPVIRRQLQEAWNLAFSWVRDEPSVHHIALPWQLLLAALSVCLTWGWTEVAGALALCWGALLRVGEFTGALRKDLLLPIDTGYTNQFALLALREPKNPIYSRKAPVSKTWHSWSTPRGSHGFLQIATYG